MKKGDIARGYNIMQDFSTVGGGMSQWSIARKDGVDYFIKEFLAPTYPESGLGSDETRARKKTRCEDFERRHRALIDKLSTKSSGGGGNLVVTVDFFRHGARYYKITHKVDTSGLSIEGIAKLPLAEKRLAMLTVVHSLRILHQECVVHGDLKPDNILWTRTATADIVAKLIDFDDSYLERAPPPKDELVGDLVYYSPEMFRYVTGPEEADGTTLTTKSDIFALGLIFSQILGGGLPEFPKSYQYASEAVIDGIVLTPGAHVPETLAPLVARMLKLDADDRPDVTSLFNEIKAYRIPTAIDRCGSDVSLRGKLVTRLAEESVARTAHTETDTTDAAPPVMPTQQLKGRLIDRLADK